MRREWYDRGGRRCKRAALLFVLASIATLLYLCTVGFPDWFSEYLLSELNTGRFVLTSDRVTYHPFKGLVLRGARMYAKGVVGPPCLNAEEAAATIDLWAVVRHKPALRDLTLRRGEYMGRFARQSSPEALRPPAPWSADFHLLLEDMLYDNIYLSKVRCQVVAQETAITVKIVNGALGENSVENNLVGAAEFDRARRYLSGKIETTLDPHILLSYVHNRIPGTTEALIRDVEFYEVPPRTELTFSRDFTEEGELNVDGQFWMRECTYRGVDVSRADGSITLKISKTAAEILLHPLVIVRPEGLATLRLSSYPKQGMLRYEAESSMDPRALTQLAGILTNDWFSSVRFEGDVTVAASGHVNTRDSGDSQSRVAISGRNLGYKKLMTEECSFTVISHGASNVVTDIAGQIYGGRFSGDATVVTRTQEGEPGRYRLALEVDDLDFADVVEALGRADQRSYTGRFSMHMEQEGPISPDHARGVSGTGRVRVRDGRVFMLPVFGGLSKHMANLVPGLDFVLSQGDVKLDYTLADGKITSENLEVEGDVLSLTAHGDYYLDGRLDFLAQVKLMKGHPLVGKLLRFITWPLSKLFEFRVAGTQSDPVWYPVNFSRELLRLLGVSRDIETETPDALLPEEEAETPDVPDPQQNEEEE